MKNHFKDFGINLPECNLNNIILGVDDLVVNYILICFKILLYKSRDKGKIPSFTLFKNILNHNKNIEYKMAQQKIFYQNIKANGKKLDRL